VNGKLLSESDYRGRRNNYYHQDILGSTVMVTDGRGKVKESYSYDAYGNIYGDFPYISMGHGKPGLSRYLYNGKPYEPAVGLYNYGFRDYKPMLGRWTTVDPIHAGLNWYVYVGNDPVNYVDLYGLIDIRKMLAGLGTMAVGVAIGATTLAEDFATGGVGAINDPATFVLSSSVVMTGAAIMSSGLKKEKDRRPPDQRPVMGQGEKLPPEEIGDPGDLGGPNFKPPKNLKPLGKILLVAMGVGVIAEMIREEYQNMKEIIKKSNGNEAELKKGH